VGFDGVGDSVDEAAGEFELGAEGGFASGHLSVIDFMVLAGEVEETVEEEDADFGVERVAVGDGLAGGGVKRDGEVAGVLVCDFRGRGEAEDVGGFVLAAIGAVEGSELGVGGEQDGYFARQTDCRSGTVEETGEGWPGEVEVFAVGATWRVDGDHRICIDSMVLPLNLLWVPGFYGFLE
jgi:hypothetical protein